ASSILDRQWRRSLLCRWVEGGSCRPPLLRLIRLRDVRAALRSRTEHHGFQQLAERLGLHHVALAVFVARRRAEWRALDAFRVAWRLGAFAVYPAKKGAAHPLVQIVHGVAHLLGNGRI